MAINNWFLNGNFASTRFFTANIRKGPSGPLTLSKLAPYAKDRLAYINEQVKALHSTYGQAIGGQRKDIIRVCTGHFASDCFQKKEFRQLRSYWARKIVDAAAWEQHSSSETIEIQSHLRAMTIHDAALWPYFMRYCCLL